jgi:hypothetical protein
MLEIPVPCTADWGVMEPIAGDSRARLCRSCDKPVYDSKSMTRAELYALIERTEGRLPCLQLHLRPDGTVVTGGCLSAIYRTGRLLWLKAAALAVAFWTSVFGLRRACDVALRVPWPASLEIEARETGVMGMVGVLRRGPEPRPAWLRAPGPPRKPDLDHAPPLRVLESEKDLLPPGWRD